MDGLTVGRLAVQMYADHAQLLNGFSQAEQVGQRAADNLQNKWIAASKKLQMAGTVMSAAVTAPLIAAAGAAIKLASDLEETNNKVSVAFGSSAARIQAWGKTAVDTMGMAAQTAMDSAALYGDMATGMGVAQDEAATLAMSMTQLAGDLASFKNIQIDVAKTALAGVFTGETESLKQLGIVMTETNLKQFAMSKGIKKNIDDMTQAEKVNLRYSYILSVTGNAQGDFARTSDSAANQMRMAKERVKELGAALGAQLLPMTVKALQGINKLVQGFTALPDSQKKTIITIAALVAAIGPAIKIFGLLEKAGHASQAIFKAFTAEGFIGQMFAAGAASATQAAAGTAAAAGTTAAGTAAAGATPAVAGFGSALQFALGPIALIGAALAIVIPLVSQLGDDSGTVAGKISELKGRLSDINNELKTTSETAEKTKSEISGNADAAIKLTERLYALESVEVKTNKQKREMKTIVDQLNEIYPELSLKIDRTTGTLNKSKDAVTGIITEMKKQALASAYMDEWVKKEKLRREALDASNDAYAALTAAQEALNKATADGLVSAGDPYTQAVVQAKIAWDEATGTLLAASAAVDAANAAMDGSMGTMGEVADATEGAAEATGDALNKWTEYYTAWADAYKEWTAGVQERAQTHFEAMTNITENGIKEEGTSLKKGTANLIENAKDYAAWKDNIAFVASTVGPTVVSYLEGLGPEQARIARELADAVRSGGDWQSFVKAVQGIYGKATELGIKEMGKAPEMTKSVIGNVRSAIDSDTSVAEAMAYMGGGGGTSYTTAMSSAIASDPTVATESYKAGRKADDNLISGIVDGRPFVNQASTNTGKGATDAIAGGIDGGRGRVRSASVDVGDAIPDGMRKGINNGESEVINAAVRVAKKAIAAARAALGINSPSKEFAEIGKGVPEGFAKGIRENSMLAADAVTRMSSISTAALARADKGQGASYDQRRYNSVQVSIAGGTVQNSQRAVWELEAAIGRALA